MRSVNSARTAGNKIGKLYPDVWVSDEGLRRATDAAILPQIVLHKSKKQRRADELKGALGSLAVILVMGLSAIALTALPNAVLPLPSDLQALPLSIGIAVAVVAIVIALLANAFRNASGAAKSEHATLIQALLHAGFDGAREAVHKRRLREGMPLVSHSSRNAARPDQLPTGVTPRGAEHLVAQWMRHLGELRAEVTQFQSDGGIDVAGDRYIAQVKNFSGRVGVSPIREIAGVSVTDSLRRGALFFTSIGYSTGAVEYADKAKVALFVYSAERAELFAVNNRARALMAQGLGVALR